MLTYPGDKPNKAELSKGSGPSLQMPGPDAAPPPAGGRDPAALLPGYIRLGVMMMPPPGRDMFAPNLATTTY